MLRRLRASWSRRSPEEAAEAHSLARRPGGVYRSEPDHCLCATDVSVGTPDSGRRCGQRSPLVCRSLSLPVENYRRAARVRRTSFFCDSSPRHERREGSGSLSAGKRAMHTSGHDDARGIAHTPHASAGDATPALGASALLPPLIASTPFTNFPATVVSGCERYAADVVAHVVAVALPGLLERPR